MASPEKKRPFSLHALIEQTAQMLRNAVKFSKKKERIYSQPKDLSNKNKIAQIASLLRSETKKSKKGKRRNLSR